MLESVNACYLYFVETQQLASTDATDASPEHHHQQHQQQQQPSLADSTMLDSVTVTPSSDSVGERVS